MAKIVGTQEEIGAIIQASHCAMNDGMVGMCLDCAGYEDCSIECAKLHGIEIEVV